MSVNGIPFWENTETWTAKDGTVFPLENLDPGHRYNIIAMLHRSPDLRDRVEWRALTDVEMHEGGGEAAHDMLESHLAFVEGAPWDEVFESLPLIKRLRELGAEPREPERRATTDDDLWLIEAVAVGDKLDLELHCTLCRQHLCDIEHGDAIAVLNGVARDHINSDSHRVNREKEQA